MNKQVARLSMLPVLALGSVSAYAAVPTDVTDAITGAGTDGIAVATAVLVVIVGFLAFRYMRAQAK